MKKQVKKQKTLLMLSCCAALLAVLCSCARGETDAQPTEPEPTAAPTEIAVKGNGRTDSVLCLDSYRVEEPQNGDTVVATAGEAFLNNAQLQPYYYMALSDYMQQEQAEKPDLSIPLDCQLCPLDGGNGSWQHYFLTQALTAWYNGAILSQKAEEPIPCTEDGFATNWSYYADNIHEELPAYELIYGDKPCYKPNTMHQAYLDALPEEMAELAQAEGYANLEELCSEAFGSGQTDALIEAARTYNFGYMYFTEKRYDMTPGQYNVEQYTDLHESGQRVLDLRLLMQIPEGAQVAADGTVTASEAAWEECRKNVEAILKKYKGNWKTKPTPDASFSRFANEFSQDAGSACVGGAYVGIVPGQLIPELDAWCFDAERKDGDYELFQTPFGIQVLFISRIRTESDVQALRDITLERTEALMTQAEEQFPLTVDYSKVSLWTNTEKVALSLQDVLYPDIAHQRFPEAIVYLQQDYPKARYGGGMVARGGCGVTTMAMLSTYMTDTMYTPGYLAGIYGSYRTPEGTNGDMFRYVPAELGFQFDHSTSSYDEIFAALEENRRVISLQILGDFTRAGHFLLLERTNPDGTVVVRDSNIFNYKRLSGHSIDCFTKSNIMSGNSIFYIMQEKVDAIPACSRCGDPEHIQMPRGMWNSPYICDKCSAALSRRTDYRNLGLQ